MDSHCNINCYIRWRELKSELKSMKKQVLLCPKKYNKKTHLSNYLRNKLFLKQLGCTSMAQDESLCCEAAARVERRRSLSGSDTKSVITWDNFRNYGSTWSLVVNGTNVKLTKANLDMFEKTVAGNIEDKVSNVDNKTILVDMKSEKTDDPLGLSKNLIIRRVKTSRLMSSQEIEKSRIRKYCICKNKNAKANKDYVLNLKRKFMFQTDYNDEITQGLFVFGGKSEILVINEILKKVKRSKCNINDSTLAHKGILVQTNYVRSATDKDKFKIERIETNMDLVAQLKQCEKTFPRLNFKTREIKVGNTNSYTVCNFKKNWLSLEMPFCELKKKFIHKKLPYLNNDLSEYRFTRKSIQEQAIIRLLDPTEHYEKMKAKKCSLLEINEGLFTEIDLCRRIGTVGLRPHMLDQEIVNGADLSSVKHQKLFGIDWLSKTNLLQIDDVTCVTLSCVVNHLPQYLVNLCTVYKEETNPKDVLYNQSIKLVKELSTGMSSNAPEILNNIYVMNTILNLSFGDYSSCKNLLDVNLNSWESTVTLKIPAEIVYKKGNGSKLKTQSFRTHEKNYNLESDNHSFLIELYRESGEGGTRHSGTEEQRGDRRFASRPENWVTSSLRARPNNGGQPHNTASPTAGLYTSSPRDRTGTEQAGGQERRVSMRLHRGANASTLDLTTGPRNTSDKTNPAADGAAPPPPRARPAPPNDTPRKK